MKTSVILIERNSAGELLSHLARMDSKRKQHCGKSHLHWGAPFLPHSKKEKKNLKTKKKEEREEEFASNLWSPGEVSRLQRMLTDGQAKTDLVKWNQQCFCSYLTRYCTVQRRSEYRSLLKDDSDSNKTEKTKLLNKTIRKLWWEEKVQWTGLIK